MKTEGTITGLNGNFTENPLTGKGLWILVILAAVNLILQFVVVNPVYELHRDEFLYLDQARHLAAGYISVPPLTALFGKLVLLTGGSLFWVRFFPALFGMLTLAMVWFTAEELGGGLLSKILVSCAVLFSVIMRMNILFQPTSFDILAWTALVYVLVRYIRTGRTVWIYILSVLAVLGLYNKYNIGFLLIGLFAGLLLTTQRKLFTNRSFYMALIIGILLILPNVIWQINNDFPFIHHMQALKEYQLDNNSAGRFLFSQLMMYSSSLPLVIAALYAFVRYKPYMPYRAVGISFITVLALFAIFKAKDYYAAGLYPAIFAFGAVYFEKILPSLAKKIVIPLLLFVNISAFILVFQFLFPVLAPETIVKKPGTFEKLGLLRWEDGRTHALPQDFSDMLGWKEMADIALKAYATIPPAERNQTLIFSDNYGQAGALNYYNRGKMPECYSFCTDYVNWIPRMDQIKNVLLVGDKPDDDVIRQFEKCLLIGTVRNEFAREKDTGIYLLKEADPGFTDQFYKMLKDRIENFDVF